MGPGSSAVQYVGKKCRLTSTPANTANAKPTTVITTMDHLRLGFGSARCPICGLKEGVGANRCKCLFDMAFLEVAPKTTCRGDGWRSPSDEHQLPTRFMR